ncbi:Hypothetical protein UVM_LOCUS66 [uncultured virus]|nr:Hypothetical protein UVM_LOCUS66 [uncultured virus]
MCKLCRWSGRFECDVCKEDCDWEQATTGFGGLLRKALGSHDDSEDGHTREKPMVCNICFEERLMPIITECAARLKAAAAGSSGSGSA